MRKGESACVPYDNDVINQRRRRQARGEGNILASYQPLIATLVGIAALLLIILRFRVPAFIALLLAALLAGLLAGLPPAEVLGAVQDGAGGVLGFIALVVGLGALLSAFLEAGGGAKALAQSLIGNRSAGSARYAMGGVGVLIAIPVFFDVGLILLFPLVKAMARKARRPALLFGLPLLAGLAAGHAFIPPTPGPVAVAEILGADIGLVILCGLAAGIPATLVAGPLYAGWAEKRGWLGKPEAADDSMRESAVFDAGLAKRALLTVLVPIVLIITAALHRGEGTLGAAIDFLGHPVVALIVACAVAAWLLRPADEAGKVALSAALAKAFEPTAAIILVTGAGGAFKQVLVDSGAGAMMAEQALAAGIAPLAAGFVLAALTRVAQGSATVAMLTAAGLVAPIAEAAGMQGMELALVVIAIASGASIISHVNDSGFWLVSRYFEVDTAQTLRTWTVTSTLVGVTGFTVALALSLFV